MHANYYENKIDASGGHAKENQCMASVGSWMVMLEKLSCDLHARPAEASLCPALTQPPASSRKGLRDAFHFPCRRCSFPLFQLSVAYFRPYFPRLSLLLGDSAVKLVETRLHTSIATWLFCLQSFQGSSRWFCLALLQGTRISQTQRVTAYLKE